jgi:hypothetical protein
MGVNVADGTAVGSSVAVMMYGVTVAPPETAILAPQAVSRNGRETRRSIRLCTG